ncbi:MAG: PIN domain protein [Nitrososphaerota archaeon]
MLKIYPDTSVFGGYFDPEFERWSRALIEEFRNGSKIAVISDLTLRELLEAPIEVRKLVEEIPETYKEYVILDNEAIELAKRYIEEGIVTERFLIDAQHIAIATINRVNALVSWNFKHIVNLKRVRLYNSVNLKYGYYMLEIRTPMEVIDGEAV